MSLFPLKPRPLRRDADTLRDTRLFIVACDDTYAPKQYFAFFQNTRVQVHIIQTVDGSSAAAHVLERLLSYSHEEDDERWLLLDTDHCIKNEHLASFTATLQQAKQKGIFVALSRPCFELWLLLHHIDESHVCALRHARDTAEKLRDILGQYNKTNLKKEHFSPESMQAACERAERLDASVGGGEIPSGNTTRVYQLWKAITKTTAPLREAAVFNTQTKPTN